MSLFLIASVFFFCILSLVEGHLGCFQFLAITNKAIMNIVEHVSLWDGGASFEYIPRSGIAGSSGRAISINWGSCLSTGSGLFRIYVLLSISVNVIPIGSWKPLASLASGTFYCYYKFPTLHCYLFLFVLLGL